MHDAFSDGWRSQGRGFWTKRKKSATSLLAVLALVAGIAVAFKLFDREVPNNVVRDASVFAFEVWKWDTLVGDNTWQEAGPTVPIFAAGVDTFPGDNRDVDVQLRNKQGRDASFQVHVDQASIVVHQCNPPIDPDTGACASTSVVTAGTQQWTRFVNFWTLRVQKELIYANPAMSSQRFRSGTFGPACQGGLRELTPAAPCEMGIVRGGGDDNPVTQNDLSERDYEFRLSEIDDGTDQSAFKGWTVTFSLVFNARVPPTPESAPGVPIP